jgi:hypothetical protein
MLLALLALTACSGVEVAPNPTDPAFIGNNGPGGDEWKAGPGATGVIKGF